MYMIEKSWFTDDQFEVMTDWERDFVHSVANWCRETDLDPTEKQQEVLDRIDSMTSVRIAQRKPRK